MDEWPLPSLPRQWTGSPLPPFVGRERELAVLDGCWEAVQRGARQAVFVAGEAGAGKSRLASEVGVALHGQGFPVLVGGCVPDLGAAYDPFVDPVAGLLPYLESGVIRLPGQPLDVTEHLELLHLLAGGARRGDARGASLFSPALFEAARAALVSAIAARPLLLILEDLHWAGETALRLLRYLIERTPDAPLMILATLRITASDADTSRGRLPSEVYRLPGVARLDLPPLDTEEIVQYLVRGGHARLAAARPAATRLREQTGGNPFLLREVCRETVALGGIDVVTSGAFRAPASVRAPVDDWLGTLPRAERDVVEAAAVIGESFSVALIVASIGANRTSEATATVLGALEAAGARGLTEWSAGDETKGRFAHALARQAVLESMNTFDLAQLHARVAHALEEEFPTATLRVQRLAHHYANASVIGNSEKACHYLGAAADSARARLAHEEAAGLYESAAQHATGAERRNELLLGAARSHLESTHLRRARELNNDVFLQAVGNQRLQAAIGFEAASWRSAEPGGAAITLLTKALDGVPPDPENITRVRAIAALGRAHAFTGDRRQGVTLASTSLELARRLDDRRLLSAVLQVGLQTGGGVSDLDDRLRRADELTALAAETGDVHHLGPAAMHRSLIHYMRGDPAGLADADTDFAHMARASQQAFWAWGLGNLAFATQLRRCQFHDAAQTLEQLLVLSAAIEGGPDQTEGPWALQSFMFRRESTGFEKVRRLITGREASGQLWAPGLLALYTELDMPGPAAEVMGAILHQDLARYRASASWPATLSFLVDTCVWQDDRDNAAIVLPLAEEFGGLNLVASEFAACLGSGDRLIASLESTLGRPAATAHFESALAMDRRMGSTLHEATTLAGYVVHLRRSGARGARVRELTSRAVELVERFGLIRVRRLLGAAGAPRSPRPSDEALTPRELEVLVLIGQGMSNRSIARTLVISENTAANHVRSILAKTQSANRTQAALYAAAHGVTPA